MRVLVVAEWYPSQADPVHGIWAHRQALAARDAGAEVKVLALRRPIPPIAVARSGPTAVARWLRDAAKEMRPWRLDGLEVQPVPFLAPPRPWSYASWGAWIAPTLHRALARERFDLVHAHNVLPTGDAVRRERWQRREAKQLSGKRRPRFVVSTHGPDIIHVAQRSARAAAATRRTLQDASVVIANSRWAQERCEALAGTALHARVVHFGADLPPQPPTRHAQPTLVTVAHLQERKRHAEVMRALAEIDQARRPDYVIVGEGEMRGRLEELRDSLGLAQWVSFRGQLDHEAAMAEAWRAHLCVMPSVEEPFGVAYIEAMAGAVPAIGCRGEGGPEDIAAAGEGMVLVTPGDHRALASTIEACLRDRERLGAAARATVERAFTWERCGAETVAAYEAALR
jgi:glycosyltransferase involved in cell wall biosynthesis